MMDEGLNKLRKGPVRTCEHGLLLIFVIINIISVKCEENRKIVRELWPRQKKKKCRQSLKKKFEICKVNSCGTKKIEKKVQIKYPLTKINQKESSI
jgi:hypothetical protein